VEVIPHHTPRVAYMCTPCPAPAPQKNKTQKVAANVKKLLPEAPVIGPPHVILPCGGEGISSHPSCTLWSVCARSIILPSLILSLLCSLFSSTVSNHHDCTHHATHSLTPVLHIIGGTEYSSHHTLSNQIIFARGSTCAASDSLISGLSSMPMRMTGPC
jgi:hypothetical protein